MFCKIWVPTAQTTASKQPFSQYSAYCPLYVCAFGQPQSSIQTQTLHISAFTHSDQVGAHVTLKISWHWDLGTNVWFHPKAWRTWLWCCICRSSLLCTVGAEHRCSNMTKRSQDLKSRNWTFPDVGSFEPLSLLSPAIELQENVLHPSTCTTHISRFVRPGEEQKNNLTLLWEKQVRAAGLITQVEEERKHSFYLVLSTIIATA